MKDIDLIYYKYIKTLYNIKDVDTDIDKNILRLFNEYISSNKDFKYNKSYLDDSVEDFINCVNTFKKKQKFVEEAKEKLSKKYKSLQKWIIIFDNIFIVDSSYTLSLLTDIIDNCDNKIKYILNQQIEQFNFYSTNHNNIKIYYYNTESEADFSQTGNINQSFELLKLISMELDTNS